MALSMFAYSWCIDDDIQRTTNIRIYGIDELGKNICLRVDNFTPYCYLELPTSINDTPIFWDDTKALVLLTKLESMVRSTIEDEEDARDFKFCQKALMFKKKLFYANLDKEGNRKKFPYLFVSVPNKLYLIKLGWKIKRPIFVPNIGNVNLRIHETDASPILQLISLKKLPTAGWINFLGKEIIDEKITSCDREFNVKWKNLSENPDKISSIGDPLVMSFDIEVNSSNPNRMPLAIKKDDKVFQLSAIFGRTSSKKFKRVLLTLGKTDISLVKASPDDDLEIIHCKTEAALLEGYTALIQRFQPNVIIGYNIFKFDIPYMIDRAKLLMCADFDKQGFLKDDHAKQKTIKWSSSAFKNQEFDYLDAEGRLFVDLLPIVQRDNRLPNYKLSTVAEKFIGATKDPLDHKGIFKCYALGMKGIANDATEKEKAMGIRALSVCGKYCIQDSVLVLNLFKVLTTWTGLCELAKVCNVPIFTTFTQGQQIKVFSQVYKNCVWDNMIVEKDGYITKPTDHYIGAIVYPPIAGLYDNVMPFDFSSLYPTTMIAFNICYSTLVLDDSIPDDDCHVMIWDEHLNCSHDPTIIKIQELDNIIEQYSQQQRELRRQRDLKSNKDRKDEFKQAIDKITKLMRPIREERVILKKKKYKHTMCEKRRFRWLKKPMGVLPTILKNLLDARSKTKKEMKAVEKQITECKNDDEISKLSVLRDVLDARQLALKVSANSIYGSLGVVRGYLPFMPGAMCTTYKGRTLIESAAEKIKNVYGGKIVYGDTDSNMVFFEKCKTIQECFDWSKYVEKELNKLFPPPVNIAFEGKCYKRFFILTKKRYASITCKEDGVADKEISKKGIILARRDNCAFVRYVYQNVLNMIFSNDTKDNIELYIIDELNKLCTKQYPTKMFVLTKSVGDVGAKNDKGELVPVFFKNEKNVEKVQIGDYKVNALKHCTDHVLFTEDCDECYTKALPQLKKKSEEDSDYNATQSEFYRRSLPAQVQLAERMRERGQLVDAGSRIEYVVTIAGGHGDSVANKIEDVEYYTKHSDCVPLDYLDYLRQLGNPLDQVLGVMYPELKDFTENQYKIRLNREKVLNELLEIHSPVVEFV